MNRAVGIGVQGLADVFLLLKLPYDSKEARQLNRDIFEAIYFAACSASCRLAKERRPCQSFFGSPASQGKLQFDLWGVTPSNKWDWASLKRDIAAHGMRNSLLVAPMPTASTAQIFGNNESTEPYTSNIYSRRVVAGEFAVVNKHLVRELIGLGIWNENMRNRVIASRGSVQDILEIPPKVRAVFKTVWEISQKTIIDMSADRAPFVCNGQSMNIYIADPTPNKLTSMHFYSWRKGLKTGMYYLRSRPKSDAIQFTVEPEIPSLQNASVKPNYTKSGSKEKEESFVQAEPEDLRVELERMVVDDENWWPRQDKVASDENETESTVDSTSSGGLMELAGQKSEKSLKEDAVGLKSGQNPSVHTAIIERNNEPLLTENPHRFVLYPIRDFDVSGCDSSKDLFPVGYSLFCLTVA